MSAGLRVALGARRYRTDRAFYSPQAGGVSDVAVGPDGRIVATDGELKGEQLEKTLDRFLAR